MGLKEKIEGTTGLCRLTRQRIEKWRMGQKEKMEEKNGLGRITREHIETGKDSCENKTKNIIEKICKAHI